MIKTIDANLVQAIEEFLEASSSTMHVAMPGRIVSFDSQKQTCKVQPLLKYRRINEDDSTSELEYSVVGDVPVVIYGTTECFITIPIIKDMDVLLVFSDGGIENWFSDGSMALPDSKRSHRIIDAFAIVGIRDQQKNIQNYNNEAIEIRSKDDKTKSTFGNDGNITITATKVTIQGDLEVNGDVVLDKTLDVKDKATFEKEVDAQDKINAQGDITSQGDVLAGSISLTNHIHAPGEYIVTSPTDGPLPVTGESGTPS